jgi:hypothetical protein
VVLASSYLLLVTNGAVIGGAVEFTCVAHACFFCVLFSANHYTIDVVASPPSTQLFHTKNENK